MYHAAGVDSEYVGLNSATVTWSLTTTNGCGPPAGKLAPVSGDVAREFYTPPSAGTFPGGCQDIVIASVTSNSNNYSGSGNAFYYDPSTGVTLQGQLADSSSKSVGNGIVDLYGGGREFYHGKLFAIADAGGNFKRLVPSNRTLYPFVGNPTLPLARRPTRSLPLIRPRLHRRGRLDNNAESARDIRSAINPFKPLPPVERFIRDGWFIGDLAHEQFPFGEAQSGGMFAAGSLESILQNPLASATGPVTKGGFTNWTYVWDSSAKTVVLQQPASQEGGRHAMQMTIAGATMQYPIGGSTACPANNTCYNYVQYYNPAGLGTGLSSPIGTPPAGTILAQDGSFDQDVVGGAIAPSGSNFIVGFTRNIYSVGHQSAGSPLYVHAVAYSEVPGSVTSTVSDTWSNAAGKPLAAINISRSAGSGTQIFTYSGSGTRTFYKADGTQKFQVAFSLSNGTINKDRSGGFAVTLNSGLPNPSENGTAVTFVLPFRNRAEIAQPEQSITQMLRALPVDTLQRLRSARHGSQP